MKKRILSLIALAALVLSVWKLEKEKGVFKTTVTIS